MLLMLFATITMFFAGHNDSLPPIINIRTSSGSAVTVTLPLFTESLPSTA